MNIAMTVVTLVAFATVIEYIVNIVKGLLPETVVEKYIKPPLIAAVFGIVLAFTFRLDIFAMLGYTTEYWAVAYAVTGLIISSGSVPVHELISKLRESRDGIDTGTDGKMIFKASLDISPSEDNKG